MKCLQIIKPTQNVYPIYIYMHLSRTLINILHFPHVYSVHKTGVSGVVVHSTYQPDHNNYRSLNFGQHHMMISLYKTIGTGVVGNTARHCGIFVAQNVNNMQIFKSDMSV